jgi:hypothetical protein
VNGLIIQRHALGTISNRLARHDEASAIDQVRQFLACGSENLLVKRESLSMHSIQKAASLEESHHIKNVCDVIEFCLNLH